MESAHEKLEGLTTIEYGKKGSCILVYLQLILLPVLVYGYFVLGYLGITSLPVHKHSLILMGIIFLTSLIFARHNAMFARCVFKRNMVGFNTRLKEYIVKNLVAIGKHKKSNSSFEIFMDEETKNIRNSNYASVASSVFPTMGILGTFISIAISMPNFSSSTTIGLEKEISILLSGVGTAFYVSIYGILLSLWWIFYEKLGLSLFDKDSKRMKDSTQIFFWTKEEIEQAFLKENISHFKEIGTMLSALTNEDFFNKLSKSIESKFNLFNRMIKLEEDAVNLGSKQIKESMKELRTAQEKQLDIGKVYSDILTTVQNFSKGLDDMQIKSLENYHRIKNGQTNLNSTLQALNLTLEDNVSKLMPVYETFSKDLKSTQDEVLSNFSSTLDSSLSKFWDESKVAIEDRYDKLGRVDVEDLKSSIEEIELESEEIIQHLDKLKDEK